MQNEQTNFVVPNRAWFSLTGICNNSCKWCYRKGSEIPVFLDTDFIFQAARILVQSGVKHCSLYGGEPTLHKDYRAIVRSLIKDDLFSSCAFITNGRLLSLFVPDEWSGNKKIRVTVSLHGANQDHYKSNTGSENGFDEVVRAIENLKRECVRHSVNIVVSKKNLNMMADFIGVVSALSVEMLGFTFALPSLDDPNYESDPDLLSGAVGRIHSLCLSYKQKHCFVYSLPWCTLEEGFLENLLLNKQLMFNCPVNEGKVVVIKENGALALCTHLSGMELLDEKETKEVLLSSKSFLKFWNSLSMREIRQSVDVYRHPKCVVCKYRYYCKGGCPIWWKVDDFQRTLN